MEYKFRGLTENGVWVHGDLVHNVRTNANSIKLVPTAIQNGEWIFPKEVKPETVGMFTGLKDKKGVDIYEGDLLEFYAIKRFTQQSFDELPPEIDELIIKEHCKEVEFDIGYLSTLTSLGLDSVDDVKDAIFGEKRKTIYSEDEMECDMNGTVIDESVIGIKVCGNIHEAKNEVS